MTPGYRDTLIQEYEARCKRNTRYSLRAFARDLGMAPSRMSEILAQKRGLSKRNALKIANALGMNSRETRRFVLQVESVHGRSALNRKLAKQNLHEVESADSFTTLQMDAFRTISDWYHYAILELTYLEDFVSDPIWIARRLGLSPIEVRAAIDRLIRLNLLEEKKGRLSCTSTQTASPSGVPSEALKKFHSQILERAKEALYVQSVEVRDFSAITCAIDSEQISEVKTLLKEFRRDLGRTLEKAKRKDRVYCLSMQFFGLDQSL